MSIARGTVIENAVSGAGDDVLWGNGVANSLRGGGGGDKLYGGEGNDSLFGDAGADALRGGGGRDELYGGVGADRLFGESGNDRLVGNQGADTLTGGAGADVFVFRTVADSPYGAGDVVTSSGGAPAFEQPGAKAGDLFDLTGLGDLSWGGTGRGAITMKAVGGDTFCYVNIDSDSRSGVRDLHRGRCGVRGRLYAGGLLLPLKYSRPAAFLLWKCRAFQLSSGRRRAVQARGSGFRSAALSCGVRSRRIDPMALRNLNRLVLALALAGGLLPATPGRAASFTSFWVLGDSLSDPGNLYAATGGTTPVSPPYYRGPLLQRAGLGRACRRPLRGEGARHRELRLWGLQGRARGGRPVPACRSRSASSPSTPPAISAIARSRRSGAGPMI